MVRVVKLLLGGVEVLPLEIFHDGFAQFLFLGPGFSLSFHVGTSGFVIRAESRNVLGHLILFVGPLFAVVACRCSDTVTILIVIIVFAVFVTPCSQGLQVGLEVQRVVLRRFGVVGQADVFIDLVLKKWYEF